MRVSSRAVQAVRVPNGAGPAEGILAIVDPFVRNHASEILACDSFVAYGDLLALPSTTLTSCSVASDAIG